MRLKPELLLGSLKKVLEPIYIVTGDEPLQVGETTDLIRKQALEQGYSSREILDVDAKFDWNLLIHQTENLSLFSDKKIIDLRIPKGKPGREGSAALVEYCKRIPEDTLLLITLPKLESAQLNSKWVKTLDKSGVLVQIWPIEVNALPQWINKRLQQAGLKASTGAVQMLAYQGEGNLLAASQEIEKLALIHENPEIEITADDIQDAASDNARFDVYKLVDSALEGNATRSTHILTGLKAEGVATPIIVWALAREIRNLAMMAAELQKSSNIQPLFRQYRVWEKRKPIVSNALKRIGQKQWLSLLQRCHMADKSVKGLLKQDTWLILEKILLTIAGLKQV